MDKARTGKALSVAAVANLAVAGFAAGPVGAATHAAADATATTARAAGVPSAGRALPGLLLAPTASQAAATTANAHGFVPKPRAGVKPDVFKSTCSGEVCIGVSLGFGSDISYEDQHFFSYSGCHLASWYLVNTVLGNYDRHVTTNCYHEGFHMGFASLQNAHLPDTPDKICVGFQNVPGKPCEAIVGE
jgi:hypothetical protein